MIYWGWADNTLTVVENNKLLSQTELTRTNIQLALELGRPKKLFYHQRPWVKKLRQLYAKQYERLWDKDPNTKMRELMPGLPSSKCISNHYCHANYGYYTSDYSDALVVVVDSVAEWDTTTVWECTNGTVKRIWTQRYPDSLGMWYSAMTQRVGLTPNQDEHIFMNTIAPVGDADVLYERMKNDFIIRKSITTDPSIIFSKNFHFQRGCPQWERWLHSIKDYANIAAATQKLYEELFVAFLRSVYFITNGKYKNIIITGKCSEITVANELANLFFTNVYVPKLKQEQASTLGAVLSYTKTYMEL